MNDRDSNAIHQVRVQGLIDHDTASSFPEVGAKPSLKVQLREAEGNRTPWLPASIAWLAITPLPSLRFDIDAVLNLFPAPPERSKKEPGAAMKELQRRASSTTRRQQKPSTAKGRPKLGAAERAIRNKAIRKAQRAGAKQKDLALEWGLTRSTISAICSTPEPEQ